MDPKGVREGVKKRRRTESSRSREGNSYSEERTRKILIRINFGRKASQKRDQRSLKGEQKVDENR